MNHEVSPPEPPAELPPEPLTELPAERQLDVALAVVASFQQTTEHADGKANMVIAVHAGILAILVTWYGTHPGMVSGWHGPATLGCGLLLMVAMIASMGCVAQVVRPRTSPPAGRNRFAFPAVAAHGVSTETSSTLPVVTAEAWAVAEVLAGIAVLKYGWVNRALLLLLLTVLAAMATAAVSY